MTHQSEYERGYQHGMEGKPAMPDPDNGFDEYMSGYNTACYEQMEVKR